ncbi:MAG: hypothetical protein ACO1QB_18365 [Verrucomicrobiales bacterium]
MSDLNPGQAKAQGDKGEKIYPQSLAQSLFTSRISPSPLIYQMSYRLVSLMILGDTLGKKGAMLFNALYEHATFFHSATQRFN